MTHEAPACSLSTRALDERLEEWGRVLSLATTRREVGGAVVSTFPPDPEILRRLEELIAAESECCPFLEFDLGENRDQLVLELRMPGGSSQDFGALLGLTG